MCSIDGSANDAACENIIVDFTKDLVGQHQDIFEQLETKLNGEKLDAVLCVAGGWAGGSAKNADFVKNCDLMLKQSTWTSVIAASLSAKFLKEGGVCALTGAQPCLKATPGMIGELEEFAGTFAIPMLSESMEIEYDFFRLRIGEGFGASSRIVTGGAEGRSAFERHRARNSAHHLGHPYEPEVDAEG